MRVRHDVRSIEKLLVPESTKGTLASVGLKNPLSKRPLMEPDADCGGDINPTRGFVFLVQHRSNRTLTVQPKMRGVVDCDREDEFGWIVRDDIYRPGGSIPASDDAVQVDEGQAALHGEPKATIVDVTRVSASVLVPQKAISAERVVVWPLRRGRDRERHPLQDLGLKKMPWGPTSGTRTPSSRNPPARTLRLRTSPCWATCWASHSKAAVLTRVSCARSNMRCSRIPKLE